MNIRLTSKEEKEHIFQKWIQEDYNYRFSAGKHINHDSKILTLMLVFEVISEKKKSYLKWFATHFKEDILGIKDSEILYF